MSSSNIAVIYYSATGSVHRLARAVAKGAADVGAEVRLRRVAELAPDCAIDTNPAWRAHLEEAKDTVEEATLDHLDWADGFAFGTRARHAHCSNSAPLARDATPEQAGTHDRQTAKTARYKLGRITADDADGYHRVALWVPKTANGPGFRHPQVGQASAT